MQTKRVSSNVVFGSVGLGIGSCIATVVDGRWTADWVAATGTWAGSIGTVAALLWALASFRSDQADRERARVDALAAEEKRQVNRAGTVSLTISEGAVSPGEDGEPELCGVTISITNLASEPVVVQSVGVGDNRRMTGELHPTPDFLVHPYSVVPCRVDLTPMPWDGGIDQESLSDIPVFMTYLVGADVWCRSNQEPPERVR